MAMALNQEEQTRVNNVYNEREKALSENNQLYGDLMNQAGELKNQQNAFLALKISDYTYVLENGIITLEGVSSKMLGNEEIKKKYLGA